MALIVENLTNYNEPESLKDAQAQSQLQKPYKPQGGGENYNELIEACLYYVYKPALYPKPSDQSLLDRVECIYNMLLYLKDHPEEPMDYNYGESNWFVRYIEELMNTMVFKMITVSTTLCSVTGAGKYEEGETCTLVATPAVHAHITSNPWTGLPASATISADFLTASFTVDQDYNITCIADEDPKYLLTFKVSDSTQGSIDESFYYGFPGESVTVTATPVRATTKYHFLNWRQDATIVTTENPHEFTIGSSNETFTCYFEEDAKYTWSFYGINGTVTTDQFTGYVGDQVLVDFEPAEHHHFQDWNDGSTECPRLFTLTATTASYTANGVEDQKYTLTFLSEEEGTVSPTTFTGYPNDTVTVTAYPDAAHDFKQWSDGNADNPRLFTVGTEDQTFTASYEAHKLTLTFESLVAGAGTITPSSYKGYQGDFTSVSVTNNRGYEFSQWTDFYAVSLTDGSSLGITVYRQPSFDRFKDSVRMYCWDDYYTDTLTPNGTSIWWQYIDGTWTQAVYTFDSVTYSTDNPRDFVIGNDDCTYNADFNTLSLVTYTFLATNGTVSPTTAQGYPGDTVEVTFTPDTHYTFDRWDDENFDNPRTFTFGTTAQTFTASGKEDSKHRLTLLIDPTTAGSFSPSIIDLYEGQSATLEASLNDHFTFSQWSDGSTEYPRVFTMGTADVNLTCQCNEDPKYTLSFLASPASCGSFIDSSGNPITEFTGYTSDTVTVTVVPGTDCRFIKWTDGDTNLTRTFPVGTSSVSYTAELESKHTLTFVNETTTFGEIDTTTYYGYPGETVTVTATAYRTSSVKATFNKWTKNGTTVTTESVHTFTVGSVDETYSAWFVEDPKYTFTFNVQGTGSVDVTSFTGYAGDSTTVTATTTTGHRFKQWSDGNTDNPRDFTIGTESKTYTVVFEDSYTLTFTGVNGTVSRSSFTGWQGDTVEVTFTPSTHYHWSSWNDGPTDNPRTFTVDTSDVTYTATALEDTKYTLTFVAGVNGNVRIGTTTSTSLTFTGYTGDTVEVSAVGDSGYGLDKWNDGSTDNPRTVTVATSAVTYSCTFKETHEYTITFNIVAGHVINTSTGSTITEFTGLPGATVEVEVIADTDYEFDSWDDASTDNPRTFTVGSASKTVTGYCLDGRCVTLVYASTGGTFSTNSSCYANLEVSEDKSTWTSIATTHTYTMTGTGTKLYVRGISNNYTNIFGFGGGFTKISGPLTALIDYENYATVTPMNKQFTTNSGSNGLFYSVSTLEDASGIILPISCPQYGCAQMFQSCGKLTKGPSLANITSIGEYAFQNMFSWCVLLEEVPALPASTVALANYCYYDTFNACLKLTTVPDLPAETLAQYCYREMFANCKGLTDLSSLSLSAKTVVKGAYYSMFTSCTGLQKLPSLEWTTVETYGCYGMFKSCTGLIDISSCTFPDAVLNEYCYQSMFESCTSMTTPMSSLPTMTLIAYCYSKMFYGCTALTKSPALPATAAVDYAYDSMFYKCTSLVEIHCQMRGSLSTFPTCNNWVYNVTKTGVFYRYPDEYWYKGNSGCPDNFTLTDET